MKTLEQFLSDYLGKSKGYPDGKYVGECLSIVKIYIKECFGINPPASGSGSAYGYWSKFPNPLGEVFEKVLNTDDLIPQKGWIGIMEPWDGNPYGHIFIVADDSTKYLCKNWAQNWTSRTFQLESNRYTNVIGFLKPKSIINDMTDNEKLLLGLINDNGITEGDIRWVIDLKAKQTVPKLEKKVAEFEKEIESFKVKISEFEAKFVEKQELIDTWQKRYESANTKLEKSIQNIDEITKDRDEWRSRYNNKNDQYNNDLTIKVQEMLSNKSAFDLIKLGFKKLFIK